MSQTSYQRIKAALEDRASKILPRATGTGSPFAGSVTTGITKSCIRCGKHRPQSQLTHWRGTFYQCTNKDECK